MSAACASVVSASDALADLADGQTVMVGGFGLVGCPLTIVAALVDSSAARDLTVISNNLGEPGLGLGRILPTGRLRKAIGSYFTSNGEVVEAHAAGEVEVEVLPQGTMAEAIRAAGAGIAAFYVRTAAGTALAEGRETRRFRGHDYVLQEALAADVALIRAHRADRSGNLVYRRTARNFNPEMAAAAKLVVAEVDEVVPVGDLDPEEIVTPGLFVDRIVEARIRIEDVKETGT